MKKSLIFELGCEDLPALQIDQALGALRDGFVVRCGEARIGLGEVVGYATPRRLALFISEVAERQEDLEVVKVGPALEASKTADGQFTPAALGFLKGLGAGPDDVQEVVQERKKGKPVTYIAVRVVEKGVESKALLGKIFEQTLAAIHWKKPMRWGSEPTLFARPIHWILAILGDEILPLSFAGVSAGNLTYGHRFMAPAAIVLNRPKDYVEALRSAYVLVDIQARRQRVLDEAHAAAESVGGHLVPNDALLDEVVQILEWPVGIVGGFSADFLALPREVIETTMCKHQRYFSVVDDAHNLMPNFVTLSNTEVFDRKVVARGNERVLVARLKDAEFFFHEDARLPLLAYNEKLERVRYIEGMGSTADKVRRIEALARAILPLWQSTVDTDAVIACAQLCKADLATGMVGEFPELQGIMGEVYAQKSGAAADVALGIREHYAPRQSGEAVASNAVGAIVGMADKLDTIAALFALGKIPSGAADPFALRRSAVGILRTMAEHGQTFGLILVIEAAIDGVRKTQMSQGSLAGTADGDALASSVAEFMTTRLRFMLADTHAVEVVDAVLAASTLADIPAILGRVEALSRHRASAIFETLMITFKRVANIVRQANEQATAIDSGYFEHAAEADLNNALNQTKNDYTQALEQRRFNDALAILSTLRAPTDAFFDAVLVNCDDERRRLNRLALLASVATLLETFCDVRKL
ncbi:MAG: glycine--tRNA ligase subunit beta [Proteobacteria bacterium]|nr:glycine--tRNA ligase subunit beta [Pseudomonadota bacterium]